MTTTPYCLAILPSASVLGPGIDSASWKNRWSSVWQKYWDRNISCVAMTFAPALAACSTSRTWCSRLAAGSAEQAICVSPTWTIRPAAAGRSVMPRGIAATATTDNPTDNQPARRSRV